MDKRIIGVLSAAAIALMLFIAVLLGTVFGAFAGWVVGLLFLGTLALVSTTIFGSVVPTWQLGAALGFVGGFFSTNVLSNKN